MVAFYDADLRRIYGVVFHALLHGEATVHLLVVGFTICRIRKDHNRQILIQSCDGLIGGHAQAHDPDADKCQDFFDTPLDRFGMAQLGLFF